ncbi:MAG TPA: di-heme oxidoredictase family protein, partial [Candidatus Saccharimonadales bacterium]|nr:di-heme oxidoredictase family protein [Candidatus Saccharimonadales bacterium]
VACAFLVIVDASISTAQVQLNLQLGVEISWPTTNNYTYQPEWSSDPVSTWTDLGELMPGDGTTNSLYDPVPSGARSYQVLEMIPGAAPLSTILTNGGFESGSANTANNWTVDTAAGGPVYAMRTNDNPHSGSFNFEVHLASADAGPVVQFNQAGAPVTGGTTYPFVFYANALSGSAGYNAQWRIVWNSGGDTGYQTFIPGNNSYVMISNSITAPVGATSATIYFHFAGAASPSQSATIDLDDVALDSGGGSASPGLTNILPVVSQPVATIIWPTTAGTQYQPEITTNLAGIWNTNFPMMVGDGNTSSMIFPMTNNPLFFRLYIPPVVILPPSNVQQIISGLTNAIGLAWTASSTPGVTGYRILYGLTSDSLTNSMDVGNVNSATIANLTSDQTYYIAIITLTSSGQSLSTSDTIMAQPDTTVGVVPLFDASTPLEPDTISNTPTALITRIADRPRGRHARENGPMYSLYDTYLIFYWEQRMTTIEIDDTIGKGGNSITFHMQSLNGLDTPNIRFFFQGQTTVAQYGDNEYSVQADSSLTNWMFNLTHNATGGSLQVGDKIEFEFSPFMISATNGQDNYYGGVILYVAGQGIVPWQTYMTNIDLNPANDGPLVAGIRTNIDSYPIPTNGWLGGGDTMPYQYSGETNHVFNQLAPNASPATGEPFLLGRRLHETDFADGTHAEPGNSVYTEQIGKVGPKFINHSCVACHVNNGRALPPAIGAPMLQSVVRVGSDANGRPDPLLGSILQPQSTSGSPEDTVTISSYTIINGQYGDGTPYTLQKPNYSFGNHTPAFYSVRLAPQLVGMGLLEAVSESTIQALADTDNGGTNGIAGRIQTVTDPQTGQPRLGRFGYKAGKARVNEQIAGALNTDMGVTTSIFPILDGDTTSGPVELSDNDLTNWTRYISSLGVNARRNLTDPQCLQGEQLFASANCMQCHTPTLQTSRYAPIAELRNQTIHPYTDLLLHDMGPGLADDMGEGNASGSQWRTSPLWSIGLTAGASGGEAYLHDGRARTLEEAILWHGGEAEASQEAFRNMSAPDRAALIAFLKSL